MGGNSAPALAIHRRLLAYLAPYRRRVLLGVAAALVSAIATSLYAYLVGPLLRSILAQTNVRFGPFFLERADLAWKLPLIVTSLAVVKAAAQFLQNGWTQAAGQCVISDLRRDLFSHLLQLPPRYFEERHSGELLSRFTADVAQAEFSVTQALTSYVRDVLQMVALLAICLWIDARLFLLTFIVLPAAIFPVSRFARSLKKVASSTQASLGQLTELAAEQLHNLPVIQAYRAAPRSLVRFDALQSGHLGVMQRSLWLRGAFTPTLEIVGIVGVALAVGVGARAVALEPSLASKLVSFLAAALLMYQPLKGLSGTFSLVVQGLGAAQRLFQILDEPVPIPGAREAQPLQREIRFQQAGFSYPGNRQALHELTFSIPAGRRLALVGESGAGKTTVFSLLLGFISADRGLITWDGEDLRQYRLSSLRAQVAWVPQDPVLFSESVRYNLLVGRSDASDQEIWEALRRAHAHDFVQAFPLGLEEPVGERGSRLSGGQRQRLAIARAFLRQPSLLLMDEPTSSLDAASEQEVHAGLSELMEGRTTVVIAHRLSTVRDADWICVLDHGSLVEEGTHADLVARQGLYVQLLRQGQVFLETPGPTSLAF